MAYESTWAYGDYDLADIDTRLAEILLSAEARGGRLAIRGGGGKRCPILSPKRKKPEPAI